MDERLSFSVELHEEMLEGKKVFVAECIELGVSDFGDNIDEALTHLKEGINLLLEEHPEKREILRREEPILMTRLVL